MTEPIPSAIDFPNDLWDYLPSAADKHHRVFAHLPTREDRDRLLEQVRRNTEAIKRVQLWNYFFRIDPEQVGTDQQASIERLEQELARTRGEQARAAESGKRRIEAIQQRVAAVADGMRRQIQALKRRKDGEREAVEASARRKRTLGQVLLGLGGLFCVPLLILFSDGDGVTGCLGLVLFAFLVAPFLLAGLLFVWRSTNQLRTYVPTDLDSQMHEVAAPLRHEQENLEREVEAIQRKLTEGEEELAREEGLVAGQARELRQQIAELRAQVPRERAAEPGESFEDACRRIPTDDEVAAWLTEDVEGLMYRALEETGMEGRLGTRIRAAEDRNDELSNVFCIAAPAEIQGRELIPRSYVATPGSDRAKHLSAKRYAFLSDGRSADFHAVYNVQFIIVADDVLASFRTTWDFVDGDRRGEEARSQHYADVVAVQDYRGYREFQVADPTDGSSQKVFLDNAPTLKLSLTSSELVEVTWVSPEYFAKTQAPVGFDAERLFLDPVPAAEDAIKAVRQRVDTAKRKREWRTTAQD